MALDIQASTRIQFLSPRDALDLLVFQTGMQVLDVRLPEDRAEIPRALPRSRLIRPFEALDIPGPCLILCHKGQKLSIGTAALRATQGLASYVIEGGICAWQDAGLPSMALSAAQPGRVWAAAEDEANQSMGWLAARLLPQDHTLLQVPKAHLSSVCDKFGGSELSDTLQGLDLIWPAFTQVLRDVPKFAALLKQATPAQGWTFRDILLQAAHKGLAP